ncbi:MAG: bifunctional hydroxymethylpyrimidine kinase/phosphomethylpyrimidine kinase [Alphaproteobacteria bacterium]|nr:bifunctional hydroxymethylpyrimidine kinase/phosphomethylpyrimidine kinase [Alphaproteobacteria bacterium]
MTVASKAARILIIAGSDSSGGAGIQAGIKTASAFGAYAMTAITAVTVQNTKGVHAIHAVPPSIIREQILTALSDIGADAIVIGMLFSAPIVRMVAGTLASLVRAVPIVVDPVMVSTSGTMLLDSHAVETLKKRLLPLAALVTPNIPEMHRLAQVKGSRREDIRFAAGKLRAMGAGAVLVKGGHLTKSTIDDVLIWEKGEEIFAFPRIKTRHTHGTGCTLATAIACGLGQGLSLPLAVGRAREYVQRAIAAAPGFGHGRGPLGHAVKP